MQILGIIPARFASTRFPGKPLHLITGKPLIQLPADSKALVSYYRLLDNLVP